MEDRMSYEDYIEKRLKLIDLDMAVETEKQSLKLAKINLKGVPEGVTTKVGLSNLEE